MKNVLKVAPIVGLLVASQLAYSAPVTDTYTTGDTLTAAKMNNIKSAVNDNNTRLTTNATAITSNTSAASTNASSITTNATAINGLTSNFSGYGVPFSTDGASKNVIVLKSTNLDGSISYRVRSRYHNSTELVKVNDVDTTPPLIANYVDVDVDLSGNLTSIYNHIDTPETINYVAYNIEKSSYDISSILKTVTSSDERELWKCHSAAGGSVQMCLPETVNSSDNSFISRYPWTYTQAIGGPITINEMTFDDVRIEAYIHNGRTRVRAKGIGLVYQQDANGAPEQNIIFYRNETTQGGSLVGTPFASGAALDGVFF